MLEWVLTAKWANMTFEEWCELEGDQQAVYIAARRAELQIEAVVQNEAMKQAKRKKPK